MSDFREDALTDIAQHAARQQELETQIAQAIGAAPHEVILDIPEPPTTPPTTPLIATEDGRVLDMTEISTLTRSLAAAERDHWRLRVIVPTSKREHATSIAGKLLSRELG